jgi:hypothetical protein
VHFQVTLLKTDLCYRPHSLSSILLGIADPGQTIAADLHCQSADAIKQLGFLLGSNQRLAEVADKPERAVGFVEGRIRHLEFGDMSLNILRSSIHEKI